MTDTEWLQEIFEMEYCHICAGDARHHTVYPSLLGGWFACCDHPPIWDADGRVWAAPEVVLDQALDGDQFAGCRL